MFTKFFYTCKNKGLNITLKEWLSLIEALDKGLANSSLMGFYQLCRSILVKTESDYDKFDQIFAEYFEGIETPEDLPEEFWRWLNESELERDLEDYGDKKLFAKELEELLQMFEQHLEDIELVGVAHQPRQRIGVGRQIFRDRGFVVPGNGGQYRFGHVVVVETGDPPLRRGDLGGAVAVVEAFRVVEAAALPELREAAQIVEHRGVRRRFAQAPGDVFRRAQPGRFGGDAERVFHFEIDVFVAERALAFEGRRVFHETGDQ